MAKKKRVKHRGQEIESSLTWRKFCEKKLNKPGTKVKVNGKKFLIGDVNALGGV